jgi:Glycosyl hydrolases family 43
MRAKRRTLLGVGLGVVTLVVSEGALAAQTVEARRAAADRRRVVADSQRELTSTNGEIADMEVALEDTRRTITTRAKQRRRASKQLHDAEARKAKAARELAAAKLLAASASLGVAAVRTCADGVGRAALQSHAGNNAAAVGALQHAEPSCIRVLNAEGSTAVYPFDFSDPSLLRVGHTYYAYSTNNAAGEIQVITSRDLHQWTLVGNALPRLPRWATSGSTWAPAVVPLGGQYVAYYTVRDAASGAQCLSVAMARAPAGPFVDTSPWPLVCQRELNGSIDPRPFVDAGGRPYLLWSSPGGRLPAIIWSQPLAPDGRGLVGSPSVLLHADRAWEKGVVEAPSLVSSDGMLVLFYAGNRWSTPDYAIGEARCASPSGPCLKRGDPVFASHDAIVGPGSPDFVTAANGDLWMAFAAYRPGDVGYPASRLLHVARVHIDRGGVAFTPK